MQPLDLPPSPTSANDLFSTPQQSAQLRSKKRHAAYLARKAYKRSLIEQVQVMEQQVDSLKCRLLVEANEATKTKSSSRKQITNGVLEELIQQQHTILAGMHAHLTAHVQRNFSAAGALHHTIRLGKDWSERNSTLAQLRHQELDISQRFLLARSKGLDPRVPYCHEQRFERPEEEFCFVRFDLTPIPTANAKTVFDALVGGAINSEMILSEIFSSVTVREDTNFESDEFSQLRLLSSTSSGTRVESNTVAFSKFMSSDGSGTDGVGLLALQFVDVDELYPYDPQERVRRDGSTIVMVQTMPAEESSSEPRVLLIRQTWLKLHLNGKINPACDPEREIQESCLCYGDTGRQNIDQHVAMVASTLLLD